MKDAVEERGRVVWFKVAVEFEKLREQRKDEGERYLGYVSIFLSSINKTY